MKKITFTVEGIKREIHQLEGKIAFLYQVLGYITEMEGNAATITPTTIAATTSNGGVRKVGIRAQLLRTLHKASGAMEYKDLYELFPPAQRKSVNNALATMRRRSHIRDTAKGRIELTTSGIAEAQWYTAHPTQLKRGTPRKAKKGVPNAS